MSTRDTMKYSIFHVQGGIGKHIAATAVAKAIKANHPDRKLIVVCVYPDIFINLPYVHRAYALGKTQYFYQEYVQDKDSILFHNEPYYTTNHIHKRKRLIENWCDMHNLEYSGEKPDLIFNKLQFNISKKFWERKKPVMIIHTNGGVMSAEAKPYSWTRDMPFELAQELTDHYKSKYHIIQLTKLNSPKLNGAEHLFATQERSLSLMEYFSVLLHAKKRILIDSCVQHAAMALNKKSTVLWNGTSPKVFGYDLHHNITTQIPHDFKLPQSYLFDFDFNGNEVEYPYEKDVQLFNIEEIIKSVDAQ